MRAPAPWNWTSTRRPAQKSVLIAVSHPKALRSHLFAFECISNPFEFINPPPSIRMHFGPAEIPIRELRKTPRFTFAFFQRAGI